MIEKVSSQVMELCLKKLKENEQQIKTTVLDPLIMHIIEQIQPFVIATIIYGITTLILIILLVIIVLWPKATS
jgi:hypothetical protein